VLSEKKTFSVGKKRRSGATAKSIANMQAVGPYVKRLLKHRGIQPLPFYDFLDSHATAFNTIAEKAKKEHPSLLAVHELGDEMYYDTDLVDLGYLDFEQVFYTIDDSLSDYGKASPDENDSANLSGFMTTLRRRADGQINSVIMLRRDITIRSMDIPEARYLFKCAALLHEIGHVEDLERKINFDPDAKRMDVIEAEVFAQLWCLKELAALHMWQAFDTLVKALVTAKATSGYLSTVAKLTLERMPEYRPVNWLNQIEWKVHPGEERILGPKGMAAFRAAGA
jgi:hypothetical protein